MKDVYKFLNNQDKVTIKQFHHIICDPDLVKIFFVMRRIPCACTGCVEKLSKPWSHNWDKNLQPRYDIESKTCK